MESFFSKFAKGVQHFSVYLAREEVSGTVAVTNATLSHAAYKKSWPFTIICQDTATVLQPHEPRLQPGILDSMQAKGGVKT